MTISTSTLIDYMDSFLNAQMINDYCPNGLQIQGSAAVSKVVTGVTASKQLIEQAVIAGADALLVHHGYFWKGEALPLTGMKYERIKLLIENNINLIAYHLPLDVHHEVGNNVQLGKLFELNDIEPVLSQSPAGIVMKGTLARELSHCDFKQHIEHVLNRDALSEAIIDRPIKSIAWCTGGGQGYIESAYKAGCDAFVTGEVSEQTIHVARELGIDFFAAGHHATERYGVKALGEHIRQAFNLDVQFIDIPNPA